MSNNNIITIEQIETLIKNSKGATSKELTEITTQWYAQKKTEIKGTFQGIKEEIQTIIDIRDRRNELLNQLNNNNNGDFEKVAKQVNNKYDIIFRKKIVDLQHAIYAWREIQFKLAYVVEGKKGALTVYIANEDISHWQPGGKIQKEENFDFNSSEWEKLSTDNPAINKLDIAEKEVWKRYNISREKIKTGIKYGYVLWRLAKRGQWQRYKVNNTGIIKEAYVNFFIYVNDWQDKLFAGAIEESVGEYVEEEPYGMTSVDSLSGFLRQDIKDGNIEYAVKGIGASFMKLNNILNQYIDILDSANTEQEFVDKWQKVFDADFERAKPIISKALEDDIKNDMEDDQYKKFMANMRKRVSLKV